MNFKVLPSKKIREIKRLVKDTWDYKGKLDYVFFTKERKIYIINKDIAKIDFEKLRINSIGLYFGELNERNQLRLSIEGSQIIGPKSAKNILELNNEQAKLWIKGADIESDCNIDNFVIIKNKNDFLGCGKPKNGKILNFVPKARMVSMD